MLCSVAMKTCTACGEQKPLSDYYHEKGKPRAKCKDCHKATAYRKRLEDRDGFNEERREYAKNNRAKINQRAREFRERHGDRINEQRRQRRAEDPDHRERVNRLAREALARDKERRRKNREANRRWVKENREHLNAYAREYNKRRPDVDWNKKQRRRAAEKTGKPVDRQAIWERDGGTCRICNEPIKGPFHIDHIVPLALGGTHEPANCQLAHPACNQEKWIKLEGQIHLPV